MSGIAGIRSYISVERFRSRPRFLCHRAVADCFFSLPLFLFLSLSLFRSRYWSAVGTPRAVHTYGHVENAPNYITSSRDACHATPPSVQLIPWSANSRKFNCPSIHDDHDDDVRRLSGSLGPGRLLRKCERCDVHLVQWIAAGGCPGEEIRKSPLKYVFTCTFPVINFVDFHCKCNVW